MPIIIGNTPSSTNNKPKPTRVLLKNAVPMLTGRPTSTIGWFSSTYLSLADRYDSFQKQIEAIITKKGTNVHFEKSNDRISDSEANMLTILTEDTFKIKEFYSNTLNEDVVAYFVGFTTMSATIDKKAIKMLVPNIYFKTQSSSYSLVSYENIDPDSYRSLTKADLDLLSEISMTEFYDTLMRYYFNTDFHKMLTDIPKNAQKHITTPNDIDTVMTYKNIKDINHLIKFNAAQLSTFVTSLVTETKDYAKLKQILLQFPELTFASLSQQFELLEPTLPPLI